MKIFSQILKDRDWENQHVIAQHVIPAHAPLHAYHSQQAALKQLSSRHQHSLNGEWTFQLFDKPESVPTHCIESDFNDNSGSRYNKF